MGDVKKQTAKEILTDISENREWWLCLRDDLDTHPFGAVKKSGGGAIKFAEDLLKAEVREDYIKRLLERWNGK